MRMNPNNREALLFNQASEVYRTINSLLPERILERLMEYLQTA